MKQFANLLRAFANDTRRASKLKADILIIRSIKTYFWCLSFFIS